MYSRTELFLPVSSLRSFDDIRNSPPQQSIPPFGAFCHRSQIPILNTNKIVTFVIILGKVPNFWRLT